MFYVIKKGREWWYDDPVQEGWKRTVATLFTEQDHAAEVRDIDAKGGSIVRLYTEAEVKAKIEEAAKTRPL